MNHKLIYTSAAALVLAGMCAFATKNTLSQDSALRNLDAIQADVNTIERDYVTTLLSAYIDGLAVGGNDHPDVQQWREKLIVQTDPLALVQGFNPRSAYESVSRVVDKPDPMSIDLVIRVWQRLDQESKAAQMPTEPVYMNVPLPEGASGLRNGVAPSAIDDPALRAEYEQAIRENEQRAAQMRRTMAMRQGYAEFVTRATEVLREIGRGMSQEEREEQLESRLQDSGLQGSESLLNRLRSP